jgi:protein-S-isoprenylcysteine O-methyltransferase Ste14
MGALLAAVFALGWIPLYVCRAEGWTEALPSYRGAERFWVCVTPALLATHMTAACVLLNVVPEPASWSVGLGVAIFAAAIGFWFWGRVLIGPLRVRRLPNESPLQLRRDGAFGIVRHPMYFAYLLACFAPVLVVRRVILLVTFGAAATAIVVRAIQEERRTRAQVGAPYDEYCRDVKRLLPFVW